MTVISSRGMLESNLRGGDAIITLPPRTAFLNRGGDGLFVWIFLASLDSVVSLFSVSPLFDTEFRS